MEDASVALLLPIVKFALILRTICVEQNAKTVGFSVEVPFTLVTLASLKHIESILKVVLLRSRLVELLNVEFAELLGTLPSSLSVVVGPDQLKETLDVVLFEVGGSFDSLPLSEEGLHLDDLVDALLIVL